MRKLFTQLFSVLMLICVFGFQASTFAAVPSSYWDGEKSIPMDDDMNVDPADIATQFVVAFSDVPTITAVGGTMAVYKEGQLLKVIPVNNSSSDLQIVGNTIVVDHGLSTIAEETGYSITLTAGAVTLGDNADPVSISEGEWVFTVGDFTPPMLVDEDPLVPVGEGVEANIFGNPFELTMVFDEDIAIGEGNIAIYEENGTVVELIDVADLSSADISGATLTVPVSDEARFMGSTNYYVRVAPGAIVDVVDAYGEDAVPNAYAGITDNTSWTFTTRVNEAPAIDANVSDVTASAAKLNVTLDADGAFYYLVQVESASAPGDMTNFTKVDNVEAGVAESVAIDMDWDGAVLGDETKYEIYIVSENDQVPADMSGVAANKVVFTTLDGTAPVGSYNGGDVVVNADGKTTGAMMYFDEEVMGGEGLLSVRKTENNALAAEIDASTVTSTKVVAGDDDDAWEDWYRVVFDFGVELESATEYYVVFPNGFITDMAGNEYANPVDNGADVPVDKGDWILQSSDFEAPVVTFWTDTKTTETTSDIVDASNDDVIYIQFDEPVGPTPRTEMNWYSGLNFSNSDKWSLVASLKMDGMSVAADFYYDESTNRIEITPNADLKSNATYTVTLNADAVQDETGNVVADAHSITVTVGDNEAAEYVFKPTSDLGATSALMVEFTKDVFVGDGGEIDHALTTADLDDILTLSIDEGEGDGMVGVDAADFTAVYDPATMKITVEYSDVWPTSVCDDITAMVMLEIDNSNLIDSKEDAFTGDASATWNVKDYVAPEVTLLSGNVEMADMAADATIKFSELVYMAEDYPAQAGFLTMVTLKEGDANGKNLAFDIVPTADGVDEYTLVPVGWSWTKDKTYYYGLGEIFEDNCGNAAPATYSTFTVVADPVDPAVEAVTYTVNGGSAINIDDEAEGVEVDTNGDIVVKVTFNMNVNDKDLAQLVTTTFPDAATVTITADDISGSMLTIKIVAPTVADAAAAYTVTIPQDLIESNEVIGGSKVGLTGDVVITLNTADLENPAIVSQDPADGATDVALDIVDGEMTITFTEEIALGSGAITFTEGGDVEQSVTVNATNVAIASDKMSAVVSVADLKLYSTDYTVDVPKEAFEDLAGNVLDMDYSWGYTTIDNPAPEVAVDGLSPADGADLVPLTGDLQMTFTEDVEVFGVASRKQIIVIEKVGAADAYLNVDGDLVIGDDDIRIYYTYVEETDNVKLDGNLVTIKNVVLEADKEYYVLITPGAFVDLSMPTPAEYAGITAYDGAVGAGWDFTTGDVVNAEAKLEFSKLGADDLVATDSDIKLVFTKPVVKVGGDDIVDAEVANLLTLEKEVAPGVWEVIDFTGTISADKKTITIDNSSLVILGEMVGSTQYRVSFASNVLQSEGNETPLAAWSDTFMTSDYTAPDAPTVDFDGTEAAAIWYGENSNEVMSHVAELTLTDEATDAVALYYFWTADLETEFTAQSVKDVGEMVKVGSDSGDDIPANGTENLLFEEGMDNETEYRVVAIAVDAAGNMSDVEDFTYITDDVIAPELVGELPTEFSTDDELAITFNEDVVPATDAYARIIDKDGIVYMAPLTNLDGEDADANVITIVISAAGLPLSEDVATYTVEIDGGMIVDVPRLTEDDEDANTPNEYEGLFGDTFVVTTADQVDPELLSITPNNDDADPVEVGANPTFTLKFSEAVELNGDFISFNVYEGQCSDIPGSEPTLVMKSAAAAGDPFDILTAENISGDGTDMITITLNRELASEKEYVLVVNGETFDDMAGNTWMGSTFCTNVVVEDTEPLNGVFWTWGMLYFTENDTLDNLYDEVFVHFGEEESDYDNSDNDVFYINPDEPILDWNELASHLYVKADGEDIPFKYHVANNWTYEDNQLIKFSFDMAEYKGKTITYGFTNLYDAAGNLNAGEGVSFVIAEDAVTVPELTFDPGDNDDDSETLVTITPDQVITVTFNGIIFSYDCCTEDDNNLIMSLDLLDELGVFEIYDEDNDEDVAVELLTYSEESGESVVTLKAKDDLDSETVYTLSVTGNVQIGQGHNEIDYYEEHYVTTDVTAPKLIADADGVLDEAYIPVNDGVAAKSETLGLVFDEEVVGAGSIVIHRWDGQIVATVDITGNVSNDDDTEGQWVLELGDIEDIMAANPEFVTNENYYIIIPDTSIVDMAVAPNAFAGIATINEWSFELQDDSTPMPTFVQNEQMNVEVSTTIDITFDRDVKPNTDDMGWLAIYEEMDGDAVELIRITEDYTSAAGTDFSFDVSGLSPDTKYYVELGQGSFVTTGAGMEQDQVSIGTWWFSTETDAAPVVVMKSPAHEPELNNGALPGQDLVIKFNMPVAPGTGNIQLHNMQTSGDDIISSFDVADASQVVFTDSTVTISGDVLGLVENAAYYVIIPGTAISNTSTTPEFWEGITVPLTWQFSTGLTPVYPELESYTPQDTIEGSHPVFVMTFVDTVMFAEAGNLTVTAKDSTEASLVIPITAEMVDGKVVTVAYDTMMTDGLNINTTYVVTVDAGVLANDGGFTWDGVSDDSWMFTTGTDFTTDVELPEAADLDFKVYPNPFNNYIRIDNYDKLTRVVVTNIAGQRVLDIEYPSYEIQTGNLVTGVYVVTLIADDTIVKSDRIIKR